MRAVVAESGGGPEVLTVVERPNPEAIEALAARAQKLAESWDRPADAPDPDDVNDPIPDDRTVDHTGEVFEDN